MVSRPCQCGSVYRVKLAFTDIFIESSILRARSEQGVAEQSYILIHFCLVHGYADLLLVVGAERIRHADGKTPLANSFPCHGCHLVRSSTTSSSKRPLLLEDNEEKEAHEE